jgi:hypothetical protein
MVSFIPEVATWSRDCCELIIAFSPRLTRVVASCELFAENRDLAPTCSCGALKKDHSVNPA